jgi:hypothetical protein
MIEVYLAFGRPNAQHSRFLDPRKKSGFVGAN